MPPSLGTFKVISPNYYSDANGTICILVYFCHDTHRGKYMFYSLTQHSGSDYQWLLCKTPLNPAFSATSRLRSPILKAITKKSPKQRRPMLCLLHNLDGLNMKSEELLAHCLTIRGERGPTGFSEGQRVAWQHTAHVTCKQKQLVAGAGTRLCGMGIKTENRDNSRKPEHSVQHNRRERN